MLYRAPLRDLLMWLALTEVFRAKWPHAIHEEWIRNVLEDRKDLTRQPLEQTRDLMNANVWNWLGEDYEQLISALQLPDLDDRQRGDRQHGPRPPVLQ